MEWHLEGPEGPLTVKASTQDEAVEKYGNFHQLEEYELRHVSVVEVKAFA